MTKLVAKFLKDESGATAIEYGLIAAGVALAIIAAVNGLGTTLNTKFTDIGSSIKYAIHSAAHGGSGRTGASNGVIALPELIHLRTLPKLAGQHRVQSFITPYIQCCLWNPGAPLCAGIKAAFTLRKNSAIPRCFSNRINCAAIPPG